MTQPAFDQPNVLPAIDAFAAPSADALDRFEFGVIGFDTETVVTHYNAFESSAAGLSPQRVLGHALFTLVAPCMNNFMVAQRFEDAAQSGSALDETIDYVLTLRMRPVKVKLRLLAGMERGTRYVLVQRVPQRNVSRGTRWRKSLKRTKCYYRFYLRPVGVVHFMPGGTISVLNPLSAQPLMLLSSDAGLDNLFTALE